MSANPLLIVVPRERACLKAITQTSVIKLGTLIPQNQSFNVIRVGEGLLVWCYQNRLQHCQLVFLHLSKRISSVHSLSNSPCDSNKHAAGQGAERNKNVEAGTRHIGYIDENGISRNGRKEQGEWWSRNTWHQANRDAEKTWWEKSV